jgi:hypothetical protein
VFSGLFLGGDPGVSASRGYVYAGQPADPAYQPPAADGDNVRQVVHTGPGTYHVTLSGPETTVQLSPVGVEHELRHCVVTGRPTDGVSVLCVRANGMPVDTRFALSYANGRSLLDDSRRPHAAEVHVNADAACRPSRV